MSQRRALHRFYFFGLIGLVHAYVWLRLVPDLGAVPGLAPALAVVLAASAVLIPTSMLARRRSAGRLLLGAIWLGLLCMGLFSSLFVLTLLRDLVLAGASALAWFGTGGGHAVLAGPSALFVVAASLLMSVAGFVGARRVARVVRVDIPLRGCPPGWTDSPSRRSATSTSGPPSARPTYGASSTRSTGCGPTWWRSPATWSTAAWPISRRTRGPWRSWRRATGPSS